MRLSERLGLIAVRTSLQGRGLDEATRNRLWSAFATTIPAISQDDGLNFRNTWMYVFFAHIWADHYKEPVDSMPLLESHVRVVVRRTFLEEEWWEVYDIIEFSVNSRHNGNRDQFRELIASILTEEMAGFRIIGDQFVEITDETEIAAIEDAFRISSTDRFQPAREHLSAALKLLSDRRGPDFRNSIKESISAVEATAQILTGNPQAELGHAIKLLEATAPIHGALRRALLSLYGYTSDAGGIRHALTEEPHLDGADAKFMLVTCSAFVVLMIQKASFT